MNHINKPIKHERGQDTKDTERGIPLTPERYVDVIMTKAIELNMHPLDIAGILVDLGANPQKMRIITARITEQVYPWPAHHVLAVPRKYKRSAKRKLN